MQEGMTRRAALGAMGTATLAVVTATTLLASRASAAEKHPHILAALQELRSARDELKTADTDFKGHKEEAIDAVDKAIKQLKICLEID